MNSRDPQWLLRLFNAACAYTPVPGGVWSDEAWTLWELFEEEAARYGVDARITRDGLRELIQGSVVDLSREEPRGEAHTGDRPRWGRLGGRATVERYGPRWYALLARRRWSKATPEELAAFISARRAEERPVGRRPVRWTQKPCSSCGRIRNMPKSAQKCGSCEGFGRRWGRHATPNGARKEAA